MSERINTILCNEHRALSYEEQMYSRQNLNLLLPHGTQVGDSVHPLMYNPSYTGSTAFSVGETAMRVITGESSTNVISRGSSVLLLLGDTGAGPRSKFPLTGDTISYYGETNINGRFLLAEEAISLYHSGQYGEIVSYYRDKFPSKFYNDITISAAVFGGPPCEIRLAMMGTDGTPSKYAIIRPEEIKPSNSCTLLLPRTGGTLLTEDKTIEGIDNILSESLVPTARSIIAATVTDSLKWTLISQSPIRFRTGIYVDDEAGKHYFSIEMQWIGKTTFTFDVLAGQYGSLSSVESHYCIHTLQDSDTRYRVITGGYATGAISFTHVGYGEYFINDLVKITFSDGRTMVACIKITMHLSENATVPEIPFSVVEIFKPIES